MVEAMKNESAIDRDMTPWPFGQDDDDDFISPFDETEDVRPCRNDWDYGL